MTDKRKELGKSGEDAAVAYLLNNCYTIVDRNYRCRSGEIDIIAKKGDVLFFIEVKTRKRADFKEGYSEHQRKRQRQIAETYIALNETDSQISFMVLGIKGDPSKEDVVIELVEDNY